MTARQVRIAVILLDIAGATANEAFNVPSTEVQRSYYDAVIASMNAAGGVKCRAIAATFYKGNPADPNGLQRLCVDIAGTKPFAVVDSGAYYTQSALATCYPRNKLPFYTSASVPLADLGKLYPYLFAYGALEIQYKNMVFGAREFGYYDKAKGFAKLGLLTRSCLPSLTKDVRGWLGQVGVGEDSIDAYDLGCPGAFASPSDLQQAVLQFQRAGVTHVMTVDVIQDFSAFTRIAEQQRFRPKYAIPSTTQRGAQAPDPDNIVGITVILSDRFGEETTPGYMPDSGTAACNRLYAAKGFPPTYKQKSGFGGNICNLMGLFNASSNNAPQLVRHGLASGLRSAKSVDFSFPNGPNDFTGERVTYGGQFWRRPTFVRSCECYHVTDRRFRPPFR